MVQIKLTNHIFWLHELETNTVSNLTNRYWKSWLWYRDVTL